MITQISVCGQMSQSRGPHPPVSHTSPKEHNTMGGWWNGIKHHSSDFYPTQTTRKETYCQGMWPAGLALHFELSSADDVTQSPVLTLSPSSPRAAAGVRASLAAAKGPERRESVFLGRLRGVGLTVGDYYLTALHTESCIPVPERERC